VALVAEETADTAAKVMEDEATAAAETDAKPAPSA
jgi:hypothetical protein